jgi:ABC-2 type transport system permease protein
MKRALYYIKIWLMMNKNSFQTVLAHKLILLIYIVSKLLRFGFFLSFLYFLLKGTQTLAGYNSQQAIFFFMTFNVVDVIAQFMFREVYRFRSQIVSGEFDLVLVKPMSALFRALLGGADVIDLITIPPLLVAVYLLGSRLNPTSTQIFFYLALILNSLLLATAFHIAVISLAIITLEIDHTIMIYRDLMNLGRFPVDIYKQPLQGILTYLIPVGIMITLPAKALMGLVSLPGVLLSFVLGVVALHFSRRFWNFALTKYTSASS